MKKISSFNNVTKSVCFGLGLVSALSFITVYAEDSSNTNQTNKYYNEALKYYTSEQIAEMQKEGSEETKSLRPDSVEATTKDTIPTDGDAKNLNIGWTTHAGHHYYTTSNRVKVTGWQKIEGKWYFFDSTSYDMSIGWLKVNGIWYYFKTQSDCEEGKVDIEHGLGSMQNGWIKEGSSWYYLGTDGGMKTNGWIQDGSSWHYLNSNGSMKTGWLNDGGKWYYLLEATHVNKNHLNPEDGLLGKMQTGWLKDNDKIYYFNENGVMQTGWVKFGDKWYYLYSNGTKATNTIIDGCTLDADGAWSENVVNNSVNNEITMSIDELEAKKETMKANSDVMKSYEQSLILYKFIKTHDYLGNTLNIDKIINGLGINEDGGIYGWDEINWSKNLIDFLNQDMKVLIKSKQILETKTNLTNEEKEIINLSNEMSKYFINNQERMKYLYDKLKADADCEIKQTGDVFQKLQEQNRDAAREGVESFNEYKITMEELNKSIQ